MRWESLKEVTPRLKKVATVSTVSMVENQGGNPASKARMSVGAFAERLADRL